MSLARYLLNKPTVQVIEGDVLNGLGFQNFSESQDYAPGDIVAYAGVLYIFTTKKPQGPWDPSAVTAVSYLQLLEQGLVDVTASDITAKNTAPFNITGGFIAKTTGGDMDIKNGPAKVLDIKGNLDAELNPFYASDLVSTGMNLVDESQVLEIDGNLGYFFPVVPGAWGAYGSTQENNGYIIIGDAVEGVYFNTERPTAQAYGQSCARHHDDDSGNNYYLPEAIGWMTIVVSEGVPACHIAWSNYQDNEPGTFDNFVLDLREAVITIHDWGMAALTGGGRTVADEIDLEAGKCFRRIDRAALAALEWEADSEDLESGTVYVYKAEISAMATNGLWAANFDGLEMSGNTVVYRSTTIETAADFVEALGDSVIYYELASVVSTDITISTEITANDFGLTYFMTGNEFASVPGYVTEAFYQSGKDQLFNSVNYQKILAMVCASALCSLDSRLSAIEGNIKDGFNYLKIVNLDVTRKLTQPQQ